jgi:hypothetical protein
MVENGHRRLDLAVFPQELLTEITTIKQKRFRDNLKFHESFVKEMNHILWERGARKKLLRLIVISPLPYVRRGKRNYRQPAYLLLTDIECSIELLIQAYLDRVQIEFNHREDY